MQVDLPFSDARWSETSGGIFNISCGVDNRGQVDPKESDVADSFYQLSEVNDVDYQPS